MAQRSKPYTKKLAALDILLSLFTHGGWLLVIIIRELYRWSTPASPTT